MKILKPIQLTDAILDSTNVSEVAPSVYNSGTTYAAGDECHVVNGLALDVYESLQDANTGNTPASSTDWWVYRSSTYPVYDSGTTYALGDLIIVEADHLIYESLQAANTGYTPGTDTDWWLEIGATNPWLCFDEKVGSQTERTGSITFVVTPGLVEGVALFNLEATSVDLVLTDPAAGEVFNKSIDLVNTENVFDFYSYRFADFLKDKNVIETEIPPYVNATLSITINGESNTTNTKCGEIVFGQVSNTGATQYSPTYEIKDYSTKDEDIYGNYEIVKRAFSKIISVDFSLNNDTMGYVQDIFEQYRATPVVWIPTEIDSLQSPYLTYGFYNRFSIVTRYLSTSIASVEIIGLT